MTPGEYPVLRGNGEHVAEYALCFDATRAWRLLIVPALFEEANRLRRLTVEVMRRLDGAGIDSFLPDLPGGNESLQPLAEQSPELWRQAMAAAAAHFGATHILGMRGGALIMPAGLPGWHYAPVNGASMLRQMFRARILADREAGRDETQEGLMAVGREQGIDLSGYRLGPGFLAEFESLKPLATPNVQTIDQAMVGGGGLWLRAEPGEDRTQADALAAILAIGIKT